MPSSTDGVYRSGNTLIDYYGNRLDLTQYNLLGPTGPTGESGQDSFFTSGGTGTIERILSNVFAANDSSVPTSLIYDLDLAEYLTEDNQIIKFSSYQTTEDSTGNINACSIIFENLTVGSTASYTLFQVNNDPSIQGLFPAKIKFDRDPNTSPSGYATAEKINYIQSDFEISRSGIGVSIQAKIYGFNSELQYSFGLSRFPQKTWILNSSFPYNSLCRFQFRVSPDGSGTSIGIRNILRYNAY